MYYEYLINKKINSNSQDISLCELESFISNEKSYILEIVYDFLNHFDISNQKYYNSCYEKFLSFVYELKKNKTNDQSIYFLNYEETSSTITDISYDIHMFKNCYIEKQKTKTKTIQHIFKLSENENNS